MGIELKPDPARTQPGSGLPREVRLLLPREREIAEIVYELEAATANDVLGRLSAPLANPSVRSMLNRLVRKGILIRWLTGRAFIYLPALTSIESRRIALVQFADDHFAGSIGKAAETMQEILGGR